jgi:hypothetical protein
MAAVVPPGLDPRGKASSKSVDAPYRARRQPSCVKIKNRDYPLAVAKAAGYRKDEDRATDWLAWPEVRKWWSARVGKFHAEAVAAGYSEVPDPRYESGGGSGNISELWFDLVAITTTTAADEPDESVKSRLVEQTSQSVHATQQIVRYQVTSPDQIRLGIRARLLFQNGRIATGTWRWYLLLSIVVGPVVLGGLVVVILMLASLGNKTPLAVKDLWLLAAVAAGIWYFRTQIAVPWLRLVEDRMLLAEDFLAAGEVHAQVELLRDGPRRHLRFVRYSTVCPVCDSAVQLACGEPDFPGRLVGRCIESPREHVYSFDRITLTGHPLRTPPYIRVVWRSAR